MNIAKVATPCIVLYPNPDKNGNFCWEVIMADLQNRAEMCNTLEEGLKMALEYYKRETKDN